MRAGDHNDPGFQRFAEWIDNGRKPADCYYYTPDLGWIETPKAVRRRQVEPPDPDKLPALVNKKEAAALLRCSERTIDRLVAVGTLRASRRSLRGSSRVLIERASLLAYLDTIRT